MTSNSKKELYAGVQRFSISRVYDFGVYYWPRLRKQVWIYTAVSLFCSALCLIPAPDTVQVGLIVAIWTLLPLMFFCAPLIFAKGPDIRIVERLIPVSAAEKMTFFYFYILIVMGLCSYLFPYIAVIIYHNCPAVQTPEGLSMYDMKFYQSPGMIYWINVSGSVLTTLMCFYIVEYVSHNRLLWGIVSVIATNTFVGLLGGIMGAWMTIKLGYEDGLKGCNTDAGVEMLVERVMARLNSVDLMSSVVLIIMIGCIIVTGMLTYRALKRRNL